MIVHRCPQPRACPRLFHRGPTFQNTNHLRHPLRRQLGTLTANDAKKPAEQALAEPYGQLFQSLATKLTFTSHDDWYQIKRSDITDLPLGRRLLSKHHESVSDLLRHLSPTPWLVWKFKYLKVPRNWWKSTDNQREFLEWAVRQVPTADPAEGLVPPSPAFYERAYSLTRETIHTLGGRQLFERYPDGSVCSILASLYPGHKWIPYLFVQVPQGHWTAKANRIEYFHWLAAKKLKISNLDEWYGVKLSDLYQNHVGGLLTHYYNSSLRLALSEAYPEHTWESWRFTQLPKKFWDSALASTPQSDPATPSQDPLPQIMQQYVRYLAETTSVREGRLEDWYRVSHDSLGTSALSMLQRFGGLRSVLKLMYPQHPWNDALFTMSAKRSAQFEALQILRRLSPSLDIMENYKASELLFNESLRHIEFDFFLKPCGVALEIQGLHHYHDVVLYGEQSGRQELDLEKVKLCALGGHSLAEVPYWWDKDSASFLDTLKPFISESIKLDSSGLRPR